VRVEGFKLQMNAPETDPVPSDVEWFRDWRDLYTLAPGSQASDSAENWAGHQNIPTTKSAPHVLFDLVAALIRTNQTSTFVSSRT